MDLARSPLPSLFGLSVLVVADDAAVLHAARSVAFRLGLAVECADGGRAAIAALRAHPVDAVILDLDMRGLDGLGVAVAVRALDARWAGLPIVALADPADARRIERCAEVGIDATIDRSVEPAALAAALLARCDPAGRAPVRPATPRAVRAPDPLEAFSPQER